MPTEINRPCRGVRVESHFSGSHSTVGLVVTEGDYSFDNAPDAGVALRPEDARELAFALLRHAASLGWKE